MNVDVKVITNAKRREISLMGSGLKVKVTALPQDGKANEELIEFLADFFGLRKSEIRIVRGEKDKRKTLSIPIAEEDLKTRLQHSRVL
ncbi:MAG: hypothetical protein A4E62_01206 [Syntrophorhabdus sp. PtaU1.Bin002]|nr:MAG: hypothetical protein A4E58_01273 [Syntrophorhabdus sp. PtaB.Bin006]OPY71508.1 MAG: hypothetical protein A4E62_01206 [Syntrophorhabdus sp. PtaU1.Bin002]